ncbi:MAG: DUF3817 domain-containing protein [Acidothermus sp.]|nr:DUF3817 domain-containing protein [Acidothermus sp.]MCL6537291.1 DUF3817 domain-containing protein [Acidothermus sp.]
MSAPGGGTATRESATPSMAARDFFTTALGRYRLLAYIVGTGLVILVFIGVPLNHLANFPYVAKYVGTAHGILYVIYCVTCLELTLRYRLKPVRLFFMAAAGFVPFLSFVVERKTTPLLLERFAAERRATGSPEPG